MAVKKKKQKKSSPVAQDIILLVILGVGILLFLSVIGLCGIVGTALSYVLFGMFGLTAYAFPFVLFFVTILIFARKTYPNFKRKIIGLCGLYILASAFCQLIMIGYEENYFVPEYFLDSASDHLGGGIAGGALIQLFGMLIGVVGTYIVTIIGIIIFAIILTQKPLVSTLKNNTRKAYDSARETREIRLEKKKSEPKKEKRPKRSRKQYDPEAE